LSRWHQDVKPENILVVSNGKRYPHEWQYKLADLGLSHFKNKISLREDSTASDTYGTRTYGAEYSLIYLLKPLYSHHIRGSRVFKAGLDHREIEVESETEHRYLVTRLCI
jgi:serine/threonine protein kinase